MTRLAILAALALAGCSLEARDEERAYRTALAVGSSVDACDAAQAVVTAYLKTGNRQRAGLWTTTRDLACAGYPPVAP